MVTTLWWWVTMVLFASSKSDNIQTDSSDTSTCTASQFAFRLSNADIKTNKCYQENDLNDMVWISTECDLNHCPVADGKDTFLTLEVIDRDYMLWPHGLDEIFLSAFNRLVLHYKRYSLLNRANKMFFMSARQNNGAKYIQSNNMLYGAIHMTLEYLCCYTESELQEIMRLLKDFEWDSFHITLKKMICVYSENQIRFLFVFDTQSQISLKKWTFQFEQYLVGHSINVKQCRKDFEPFHASFISIKYYNDELKKNKENILNTAVTYAHDVNNHLIDNQYDLTIEFSKEMIMNNLFIAAKRSDVFEFNNQSYIGVYAHQ